MKSKRARIYRLIIPIKSFYRVIRWDLISRICWWSNKNPGANPWVLSVKERIGNVKAWEEHDLRLDRIKRQRTNILPSAGLPNQEYAP